MSNITGIGGVGPAPDLPEQPDPLREAGNDALEWLGEIGSRARSLWNRFLGRSDRLRRHDGDVELGAGSKAIVGRDREASFATREELLAAYRERLGELDGHFARLRAQGGPHVGAEARRADFELTRLYAQKARPLVGDDGLEPLLDELIAAKSGLQGLGVGEAAYRKDLDKDGLSARAELMHGTSDYAVDTDLDGVTDRQEVRVGLDPTRPRTTAGIESDGWSVEGYVWYPYFDDKPVLAFSKFDDVFGADSMREFEPFFEGFAAGSQGSKGTWVPNTGSGRPGYVKESDFARTSGVNPVEEPVIPADAARLVRRSGAPQEARFALRDAEGKPIAPQEGDRLRPTFVENGEVVLAEARSVQGRPAYFKPGTDERIYAQVAYRLVGADGAIRGGADAKVEDRSDLFGLQRNLRFDFLDAQNRTVSYSPRRGDQVVASFKDGDSWVALVPQKGEDGALAGYERRTYDAAGKEVKQSAPLDVEAGRALLDEHGHDAMYRVMAGGSGELRGDGEVSSYFDVYWWGKCHNTAKIDQSNLPQPSEPVRVARGLEPGETLAARFFEGESEHVLSPARDEEGAVTGFVHLVAGEQHETLSPGDAEALIAGKGAQPVILGGDGSVRDAEVVTVSPEEVQTLVAHMGSGATEYKGAVGSRFYGTPERVMLRDGTSLDDVRVTGATLASGGAVELQTRRGGEWRDLSRGLLRGDDLENTRAYRGYRRVAFSESSMEAINRGREDKIESLTVRHPDGRTETIAAADIAKVGRENAYDLSPEDLWKASEMIADGKSFTLEKATGPQVWNYAVKELATERVERGAVPEAALKADRFPGALAGTSDPSGRLYFRTQATYLENGEPHEKDYFYWVKMDEAGEIVDYNYLVDPDDTDETFSAAPDFFWQTHVKDPVEERWSGESEVSGAAMSDIQGLYNASVGNMAHLSVLGVFAAEDLAEGRPRRPD